MTDVEIDFRKSAQDNANEYFKKAKFMKKKIEATKKQLEKVTKELEAPQINESPGVTIHKKIEAEWYQKFRWTITTEGFLVIGGRDADQNELIFKRHIEKDDIVLHADIVGAPLTVVKSGGKQVTQQAIIEAAGIAAAYSSAWRKGLGVVDIYWITPDQVSKSPESGEYLSKGGFMIRGTKNYLKKFELKLSIGVKIEDTVSFIAGNVQSVKKQTSYFVTIRPGNVDQYKLAMDIRKKLAEKATDEDRKIINNIDTNEIQKLIPSGSGSIV